QFSADWSNPRASRHSRGTTCANFSAPRHSQNTDDFSAKPAPFSSLQLSAACPGLIRLIPLIRISTHFPAFPTGKRHEDSLSLCRAAIYVVPATENFPSKNAKREAQPTGYWQLAIGFWLLRRPPQRYAADALQVRIHHHSDELGKRNLRLP